MFIEFKQIHDKKIVKKYLYVIDFCGKKFGLDEIVYYIRS